MRYDHNAKNNEINNSLRKNDDDENFDLEEQNNMKKADRLALVVYLVLLLMGIGTGYLLTRNNNLKQNSSSNSTNVETVKTDKSEGVSDTTTFKDSAEGQIEEGGLNGEGTHSLVRDGGPSQTVYLVSSVLDLNNYVGKKVRIWGQTYPGKKVAWFMDVGKVELLD